MRKIIYVTGSRADFGLMKYALRKISETPSFSLRVITTGMHLMSEFGFSVEEVEEEEYQTERVLSIFESNSKSPVTEFISSFIHKFSIVVQREKPDFIIVLGDRPEMLAASIVGVYNQIPVAHIHGGEKTGTVDEFARHAITKLAHLHLVATKESARRVIKMGEDSNRVFVIGAPGLEVIREIKYKNHSEIRNKLGFNTEKQLIIVLQHPVTSEIDKADYQMRVTLEAIKDLKIQTLIIYPNADPGGREMIKIISKYKNLPFIKVRRNLRHEEFIQILASADVLVGNSSSGIIEAPSLGVPVVNIGTRQKGRERAGNVLDVSYNGNFIKKTIAKALGSSFRGSMGKRNPYGKGKSGNRIVKILSEVVLDKNLMGKQIGY